MIGSLRGVIVERIEGSMVLIEVGGVGYLVHVTPRTLAELEPTSNAFLYVHQHVREDAHTLFGFLDRDERRTFESLIATHGIGPSMAMAILGTHSPRALTDIVANGDTASLTLVPGVGKKTAERLLIELKGTQPSDPGRTRFVVWIVQRRPSSRGARRTRVRTRRDSRRITGTRCGDGR
ncbi:MAG: Holliday junction branch migration protein RuvA [Actinobacteria bacterium]|nr:Holliday junction branch migration protein RuvA [Actinomycetota bacterium]